MHLNDLEVNIHLLCDEPKRRERKVNYVHTFVVLNFFFSPKLLLFLKITSKDNRQADLLCSGPRTELWDSVMRREFWREMGVNGLGIFQSKNSYFLIWQWEVLYEIYMQIACTLFHILSTSNQIINSLMKLVAFNS